MADKYRLGNFFEDFSIGQKLVHPVPRTLTTGDAALYISLTSDCAPLHSSDEFARQLGYPRAPLNDLLVFHTVFGKSVPDISFNAVANLGYADVRFLTPVYPGDTLRAESEVIGLKENSSGRNGNVYVKTRGINQRDETVLSFNRWVMVHKNDVNSVCGDSRVPDLPERVSPETLSADASLNPAGFDARATGSDCWFDDYEIGERIIHNRGTTLEETEHMSATRLYQNTARVHFDQHMVAHLSHARRLIYGGHIISVARALSFSGLENGLRLLAWNSGAHANPSHAGDTIYAFTDVLDRAPLDNHPGLGALRLRLIAVKNQNPRHDPLEPRTWNSDKNRMSYHPNVVLDLDYWLSMPMRPGK
ncbi:MAG: MaoC family dehydratase [Gammaproteobacteria bacterium]|nr:MaoC family dehydratase [Gammaproteobacteria bacterium]